MEVFRRWLQARNAAGETPEGSQAQTGKQPVESAEAAELRRVQAQLEESRRELDAANRRLTLHLDHAPLACIVWGSDQIVREWNPAAETMFGYTAAEAVGRNVYDLASTPEGMTVVDELRKEFAAGRERTGGIIVENRRKDGSRLHCEWHFTVLKNEAGVGEGLIAFGIDVTARVRSELERRALEANLRQAQKMQSLGTLAGGIAHDFNNILLAISGNARLAMQELPNDHSAQVSLVEISKASTRASSIVNQILLFSRREEGAQQEPLNLQTIIEESTNLLRAMLPAKISIATRFDQTAPMVLGDASQLHQVLLNLATNAADAMSENGGTLVIELTRVEVDQAMARTSPDLRPGLYACIAVRDTGIGMSSQVAERIFEPFFTTKPRGQGTGLGLSVVHGIVRAHNAAITLESALDKGSTFRVYLAAANSAAVPEAPAVPKAAERGHGQRILYVDDEEPLVYLLTRILERLGYVVSGFIDAQHALDAFRANPSGFDALVTDLSMPVLSGHELAREVLKIRPSLPIVMTSGYVRASDREQALKAGVRELVLKPDTAQALGEILHRVLKESGEREKATAGKV